MTHALALEAVNRFRIPIEEVLGPGAAEFVGPRELHDRGGDWRRRLLIVPVGRFDLRASEAFEYSWCVPAQEHRALHVASDEQALWALGRDWMHRHPGIPLFTVEDIGVGVAETIARVVRLDLASGFDEVVIIVGRIALGRRVHRLLHDRTSESIARALAPIPRVLVGLMTVATTR